jgi:multimeric flavodoxin WrbA
MKILLINGSPRRTGNTATALERLAEKLSPHHTAELLQSYSMAVTPCLSCLQCKTNGGFCVQKDDTNTMLQKIYDAHCIVFGTPVFWMGMSGQLKLFIDKFVAREQAFGLLSKKIVNITVGASGLSMDQYKMIDEQFKLISHFLHWEHIHSCSFSAYNAGDILKVPDFEEKIQETANKINEA